MPILRLIASPGLDADARGALRRKCADCLLACVSDTDVNSTFLSLRVGFDRVAGTSREVAELLGPAQSVGRAFRLELQHEERAEVFSDEVLRTIAVDVHGALRCPVFVAKRSSPVSRWATLRPMGWGPGGLALKSAAPALPFGGSQAVGLAIEAGGRTAIVKVKLAGALAVDQLETIAAAVGNQDSGFAEVGAYPLGKDRDGSSLLVLELGDSERTPLHRVLEAIAIEARRFGASLALGALLSDAPLHVFTAALQMHLGLPVAPGQIIETHLSSVAAQR